MKEIWKRFENFLIRNDSCHLFLLTILSSTNVLRIIFKYQSNTLYNKGTRRFEDLHLSSSSKKYLFKLQQFLLNVLNSYYSSNIFSLSFTKFFLETRIISTPPYPVKENYLLFARIPDSLHRWSSPMFAACRDSYIDTFNLCYIAFYYPTVYLAEVIVRNL